MMRISILFYRIAPLALSLLCGACGAPGSSGPQGPEGPAGPAGRDGADGALRIYGDGSAGPLRVQGSGAKLLKDVAPSGNLQFTDVVIDSGVSLLVPSGTVLRCSGTFTVRGGLTVTSFSAGARDFFTAADAGAAASAANNGRTGDTLSGAGGGTGGVGMRETVARGLLRPGPRGGGGGGISPQSGVLSSHSGGGTVTVLCAGAILNEGAISALPSGGLTVKGAGGGGGGLVLLASRTSVENRGAIGAMGGAGLGGASGVGAGGGGGGGLVHLLAPVLKPGGTVDVSGGAAGTSVAITLSPRSGGGGGGGSVGSGGDGAFISKDAVITAAEAGEPGVFLQSQLDPTALF